MSLIGIEDMGPDGGMLTTLGMYQAWLKGRKEFNLFAKNVEAGVTGIGGISILLTLAASTEDPMLFVRLTNPRPRLNFTNRHRAAHSFYNMVNDLQKAQGGEEVELFLHTDGIKESALTQVVMEAVDRAFTGLVFVELRDEGIRYTARAALERRDFLIDDLMGHMRTEVAKA